MVGDLDWESYMESKPQTSLSRGDDDRPALDANLTPATSLDDHLIWQLGFLEMEEIEREIALRIVGNLNDDGYLKEDLDAIAAETKTELSTVEKVLARVQELDPVGVAARDLCECLQIQMRVAGITDGLAVRMVAKHLDGLQNHDFRGIARAENVELSEVAAAAKLIGSFEPRPGRQYARRRARLHHARHLRAQARRRVPRGAERGRHAEAARHRRPTATCSRTRTATASRPASTCTRSSARRSG